MRWPGTIQPSRFLSHTGQVLPGVRRVVTIPQPPVAMGVTFTVPAGVQWWVLSAFFSVTSDATAGDRNIIVQVTVSGVAVGWALSTFSQPPSSIGSYGLQSTNGYNPSAPSADYPIVTLPGGYLPDGAKVAIGDTGGGPADQFSACNIWIEEVYVTDAQLSEDARLHAELERDIAIYEYEQAQQAGGNA